MAAGDYTIEMQTVKVKGEEIPVEIKPITHYPTKDGKTGEHTGFGRLQFVMFRILLKHKSGAIHKVAWYNAGGMPGKFKWQQPDKEDYPLLRNGGKIVRNDFSKERRDLLAPKVITAGESNIFDDHDAFGEYLVRLCGKRLASKIIGLFVDSILESCGQKKAA